MTIELAERVQRIKPSPTLAVSAKAQELRAKGRDIINLSVGEPDFGTPEHIKEAAIAAINAGHTRYTPVDGIPALKKAIIDKLKRDNQLDYQLDQILVSVGAKHSLYNLFAAVLNEGDEVLIPAPYWVSYPAMAKLCDATPVIVSSTLADNFKITPEKLEKAITHKTKIVVLNSPSNPTGVAYTKQELEALGEVLLRHPQVLVCSDDIYELTLWEKGTFANIAMACPGLADRTIVINGASKAYAMTGWRIGYAAGPKHIIGSMKKIQSQSTSNATSIAQYAAEAALNGDHSCIDGMVKAYKERHDYVVNTLKQMPGVRCEPCDGTFYSFPDMSEVIAKAEDINDDIELAEYFLNEANIAVVPGSAFGAPNCMRISYATSMDNLKTALNAMASAIEKL